MGEGGSTTAMFTMCEAVPIDAPFQNPKCREVDVKKHPRMMRGDKLWLHAEVRHLEKQIYEKQILRAAYRDLAKRAKSAFDALPSAQQQLLIE